MRFSRRNFLCGVTALPISAAVPKFALAQLSLGTAKLSTVSDGTLVLPGSFIFEPMPKDELSPLLNEMGVSSERLEPECNVTLYQDGQNTILFDVGSGPDFMPSAGALIDSLDAAGVVPEDVTHVVFTHAHPDHIWGLLDDFGDPVFTQATYMMGRHEWDYWWDAETVNTIGDARAAFAVGAKRRMETIEDTVELFDDGQEILPGVAAFATNGHTPGHMSFEIRNGSDSALILGDAIGNHHIAFRRPEWHSGSDQDAAMAAATRRRLFDRIVGEKMKIIGFHLPGGGIGRAEASADGFRFISEET